MEVRSERVDYLVLYDYGGRNEWEVRRFTGDPVDLKNPINRDRPSSDPTPRNHPKFLPWDSKDSHRPSYTP